MLDGAFMKLDQKRYLPGFFQTDFLTKWGRESAIYTLIFGFILSGLFYKF